MLALTDGRGADVIYDPVGGDTFDTSLRCIAPDGRIIPMGFAGGRIPTVPANIVLVKNISVIGSTGAITSAGADTPLLLPTTRGCALPMPSCSIDHPGKAEAAHTRDASLSEFKTALRMIANREVMGRVIMKPQE